MGPRLAWLTVPLVAGCGDLFHGTDWAPKCEGECAQTASSAASSGGTGSGGGSSASVASTAASSGSGGDGGDRGSGGDGSGGCGTCLEAMTGGIDPNEPLCATSASMYDLLLGCACTPQGGGRASCYMDCAMDLCQSLGANDTCLKCLQTGCAGQFFACQLK